MWVTMPSASLRLGKRTTLVPFIALFCATPSAADHRPGVEVGEAEELPHLVADPLDPHRVDRPDRVAVQRHHRRGDRGDAEWLGQRLHRLLDGRPAGGPRPPGPPRTA